jgi:hypothetical protein
LSTPFHLFDSEENKTMLNPSNALHSLLTRAVASLALACALCSPASAQTPGGTTISNQASATYSDGTNAYSTVSNTVTVTVSLVSGITITPDAGSNPSVVAGQTLVVYNFTVTNTGNFTDQVRFLASGASARVSGPGTITRAVIDLDGSGTINAGDTDINTNGADVVSANILQNGSIGVLVEVSINAGATAGQTVQVLLGDAATGGPGFDNQAANSSANEVRTESALSVNGKREARGDVSASVVVDALLTLALNAPAGPVALGSDITYTWQLSNSGSRDVSGVTLAAATQVYIIAPIPARTVLKAGQTFPAGTLYTTSALTTPPLSATWVSSAPPLNTVTRIAFPVGATLAAGTSSSTINMVVTVNTGINASVPIDEIGDAFGKNSVLANVTDQSGDATSNNGDGNANFNETYVAGAGHGVIQQTLLMQVGSVLLGPGGAPGAVGPTDNNDDYTNKSANPANIAPGGTTTASTQLLYTNTVQNTGNGNDTFTLDAPTVPAGFTVEISTDGGGSYTDVTSGGSTSLAVSYASSANIMVRITVPVGKLVLNAFSTTVRATSTATAGASNSTIDRSYTGFIQLTKTFSVANATGVGGATDPVPGAVITYDITYTNISSSNGDANCVKLTASNLVINEDGLAAPNNWGSYTVNSGSPGDSGSGVVATVSATRYTDTVATVAPGTSGVFTFKRLIN